MVWTSVYLALFIKVIEFFFFFIYLDSWEGKSLQNPSTYPFSAVIQGQVTGAAA